MRRTLFFIAFMSLIFSTIPLTSAQEEYTPVSLTFTLYSDGAARAEYKVESDALQARVEVELFGPPYSNLVIRDDEGYPLVYSVDEANATVDSLGALELTFTYLTISLTAKEGIVWAFNVSSPVSTLIKLPEGAAIFDMSDVPTEIGMDGSRQYIVLEPGDLSVYYMIGLPDVEREAQESLAEAETYLGDLESMGYVLTEARSTLAQAQDMYDSEQYVESKNRAQLAVSTADETVEDAVDAYEEMGLASEALSQASSNGRTQGLNEAESSLEAANAYYGEGRYGDAASYASQAIQQANLATAPKSNSLLYMGILLLGGLIGGGYYYTQRVKTGEPPHPAPSDLIQPREIDLDKIFWHHQDLRLDDKEVIRFIAESGGEAFASEIRDRFDIPRSSAWRLIRRLVSSGIAEEAKVGNQSLVRISDEYLK
jgi:tetratricopeptide (TPR) repeat protein